MPPPRLLKAMAVFVCIIVVLSIPWPGLQETYVASLRMIGTALFSRDHGLREVAFIDHPEQVTRPTMMRIEIANRGWLNMDGSGPVRHLDLDAYGIAWLPSLLLTALILATPNPWSLKITTLLWGLFIMQLVVMLIFAISIWIDSSEIGLVKLSPFWKANSSAALVNIITHVRIAAPVIIWVLVSFRPAKKQIALRNT